MRGDEKEIGRAGVLGAVANDLLLAREPRLNAVLINSSIFILHEENLGMGTWTMLFTFNFGHLKTQKSLSHICCGNPGGHNGNGRGAATKSGEGVIGLISFSVLWSNSQMLL